MIAYGSALDLGTRFWPLAAAMSAAMIAGSWTGKRVIERLPAERFRILVAGLLAVTALQIVTG